MPDSQSFKTKSTKLTGKTVTTSLVIAALAGVGVILFLLLSTTPDRIGPIGITVFFIILLLTLISIGLLIRNGLLPQPKSASLLLAVVVPICLTGALALNTIELGIGDVVLLVLFVITFTIYWTKLR